VAGRRTSRLAPAPGWCWCCKTRYYHPITGAWQGWNVCCFLFGGGRYHGLPASRQYRRTGFANAGIACTLCAPLCRRITRRCGALRCGMRACAGFWRASLLWAAGSRLRDHRATGILPTSLSQRSSLVPASTAMRVRGPSLSGQRRAAPLTLFCATHALPKTARLLHMALRTLPSYLRQEGGENACAPLLLPHSAYFSALVCGVDLPAKLLRHSALSSGFTRTSDVAVG